MTAPPTKTEALEPCPFCGSIWPREDKMGPNTLCEYCGASAPKHVWNRRAALSTKREWSPGVAKAMEVFEKGLAKRRVDELGLPWHVEPWGDGSKPPYVNICSNSHGAVIAADLERLTANVICSMLNALVEKVE